MDNVSYDFVDSLGFLNGNLRDCRYDNQTHRGNDRFHVGDVSLITFVFWEMFPMESSTSKEG